MKLNQIKTHLGFLTNNFIQFLWEQGVELLPNLYWNILHAFISINLIIFISQSISNRARSLWSLWWCWGWLISTISSYNDYSYREEKDWFQPCLRESTSLSAADLCFLPLSFNFLESVLPILLNIIGEDPTARLKIIFKIGSYLLSIKLWTKRGGIHFFKVNNSLFKSDEI